MGVCVVAQSCSYRSQVCHTRRCGLICPTDFVVSAFTAYKSVGIPVTPAMFEQRQLVEGEVLSGVDQFILGLQVLLWNASSIGSYVVVLVFWIFLVRSLTRGVIHPVTLVSHVTIFS